MDKENTFETFVATNKKDAVIFTQSVSPPAPHFMP